MVDSLLVLTTGTSLFLSMLKKMEGYLSFHFTSYLNFVGFSLSIFVSVVGFQSILHFDFFFCVDMIVSFDPFVNWMNCVSDFVIEL